ncbi:hypothetical protein [Legionella sp. km772]|uniref:hypothetical protein n=1 Tax=Legionella sp. km772 TaxID=2498111 RepID=UPI000F8E93EC|nr:hypothetical protein [Legionella sp. km772]RUR13342.1 hypothetical protein ELY15_02505 [Legionella sp. km772]
MEKLTRAMYGIVCGLTVGNAICSTSTGSAFEALKTVKKNSSETLLDMTIHDAIAKLSAAFQVKTSAIQTGCIVKDSKKLCLKSDAMATIPTPYATADAMTLPAFVDAVIYSQANFLGSSTLLASSSAATTLPLSGLTLGSIKLIRKACLYYNKNYTGSMSCDYEQSGASSTIPLGFNSLKLASGIWIEAFQNSDRSGFHLPYSQASAQLLDGTNFFSTRPISYVIYSQNEAVDLVHVNPPPKK